MEAALIGFAVLLILIIVVRMPIALAMGLVGFFGFAAMQGLTLGNVAEFNWRPVLTMASRRVIDTAQDYHLSVIPLFVLMGNLITHSGMSQQLYNAAYAFLGHRRGGSCHVDHCRLWWFFRHLWLQSGDLCHHGKSRYAANAQVWLFRQFGNRLYRRRWNSGYPDSAQRDSCDVRFAHRNQYP